MQSPLRGEQPGTPYGAQQPEDSGGLRQDARRLIEAGDAAYPVELRTAMQRNRDEAATAALDVGALSAEFGVKVLGAAVYGLPDQEQTIVYLYEGEGGRTARWYASYEKDAMPSEEPPEVADETAIEPEEMAPYPEYDRQSVAEITNDERITAGNADAVRAYESAHRNRKGVLNYLDSLEG